MQLISPNFSDLLTPNIEIGKFPDDDSHVRIPQLAETAGQDVTIFHRLYPNQNNSLVELFLILDTLKHEKAKSVTVVVPYLPYARQDKKALNGEIASAHVVCNMLARNGCGRLVTFDCHFLNQEGPAKYGELNIFNISMSREIVSHAKKHFGGEKFEVIGPDAGAAYLVAESGGKNMTKKRQGYAQGKIEYRNVEAMEGDFEVKGKNVLIIDDMISTGSTMIRALEKMREAGAKNICCAATHGLFLFNCMDKIRKYSDCAFATDTIPSLHSEVSIKQKILDLENILKK